MGTLSAGTLLYDAGELHPYFRRVRGRAPDAQLRTYKKIIDLADVVLCVYDTDIPATSSAEDRALAYAEGQHKSLVLLHPTELTTKQISVAHDAR